MAFSHDVFLSCSGRDQAFNEALAADLARGGIKVWYYEEQFAGGQKNEDKVHQGLLRCRVFLASVTSDWCQDAGGWTSWETDEFQKLAEKNPARAIVPLYRIPMDEVPPRFRRYLKGLYPVHWEDDSKNRSSHLWEIRCAIRGEAPGPRPERARKWEELVRSQKLAARAPAPSSTPIRVTPPIVLPGTGRPRAVCLDRERQWHALEARLQARMHECLLVCGPVCERHEVFLERALLHASNLRSVVARQVEWPRLPRVRDDCDAMLARALECNADEVPLHLGNLLTCQDVVLVQKPLPRSGPVVESLRLYHSTWLPDILAQIPDRTVGYLKVVQPLAWRPSGRVQQSAAVLLRQLGLASWSRLEGWVRDHLECREVMGLARTLKGSPDGRYVVRALPPLERVREEHVNQFCQDFGFAREADALEALLRDVRRASSTSEVYTFVEAFLDEHERRSEE